jgi:hypothetical protein
MSEAFAAAHGPEVADIIMEHLPPAGWGDLATKTDVATQGQFLRYEFDAKMSELRRELRDVVSKGFKEQRRWIVGTAFGFLAMLTGVISATVALIR